MRSSLFQIPIGERDLKLFQTPSNQPPNYPLNCGAVTAQLLGLVSPETANEMTFRQQGIYIQEWTAYASASFGSPVTSYIYPIASFDALFAESLLPGFATLVLTLPGVGKGLGHYFVVGKTPVGRLVILDPQVRRGFLNSTAYFQQFSPPHTSFLVLRRNTPRTGAEHENDAIGFLAKQLEQCNISSGDDEMDIDNTEPPPDIEMKLGGRRKRRKTRRRLLAKRTLRRVNRRKRIL